MTHTQILIHQMSYHLTTGKSLFNNVSLRFAPHKTGLLGKNGIGKSTLLKLILGELAVSAGSIQIEGKLAFVPQHLGFTTDATVASVLGCDKKIVALQRILQGSTDIQDFLILNEEWDIEQKTRENLSLFDLNPISLTSSLNQLSGGEITRLLLAKAFISGADFILLDEPTNHLDYTAKKLLYDAICQWQGGVIVVSHDRELLNLMDEIVEITTLGAFSYGGNYDFYHSQKNIEQSATMLELDDAKKYVAKVNHSIQSSREKHEKKQSYGKALRRSGSIDKMAANSKQGRSERTQSKLVIKNERLIKQAEEKLQSAKNKIELREEIHVALPATKVPQGKIILDMEQVNFRYSNHFIIQNFSLKMHGPERIALVGDNASGKTTLIKLILRELHPEFGKIDLGTQHISYLNQHADLLNPDLSILENYLEMNPHIKENDAYRALASFLFKNVATHQLVKHLSGGEKLRAHLACTLMSAHPPQLLILDEPTNHLDLNSIKSIESALKNYQGAMIVISHDHAFLQAINITRMIQAPFKYNASF